jgi:asparagine synthetase B (glutamine-hydrolysing)
MSAADGAWVVEFSVIEGIDLWPGCNTQTDRGGADRGRLRVVNNPPSWRPQFAESTALCVLLEGILHNRAKLEQRLSIDKGKRANDADLALAAYLAWGEAAWLQIKGHFAVLVWDRDRDQLLCARDPIGAQPLFFAETAEKLILGRLPCPTLCQQR